MTLNAKTDPRSRVSNLDTADDTFFVSGPILGYRSRISTTSKPACLKNAKEKES